MMNLRYLAYEEGEIRYLLEDSTQAYILPILVDSEEPDNKNLWISLSPIYGDWAIPNNAIPKEEWEVNGFHGRYHFNHEENWISDITVLNTTIVTNDGDYICRTIDSESAKELLKRKPFISAVGHQSTADILTEILDVSVPMNRIQYEQDKYDIALCFKLKGRPEEGVILSKEEIEKIGYEFKIMIRTN